MKQIYRESQRVAVKEKQEVQVTDDTDPRMIQMGKYIAQGLDDFEAAILSKFSEAEIIEMKKKSTEYADFVRLQKIKFKQGHLKTISDKNDSKTSQWMLERTFPEEYGKGSGSIPPGEEGATVVAAIIRTIQRKDAQPVKVPFEIISDTKETPRHNETKRFEEGDKSLNAGGKNILQKS